MRLATKVHEDGRPELRYWDSGSGLPRELSLDKPETLGLQLIAVLASQLKARLSLDEKNAACFIFKLALDKTKA